MCRNVISPPMRLVNERKRRLGQGNMGGGLHVRQIAGTHTVRRTECTTVDQSRDCGRGTTQRTVFNGSNGEGLQGVAGLSVRVLSGTHGAMLMYRFCFCVYAASSSPSSPSSSSSSSLTISACMHMMTYQTEPQKYIDGTPCHEHHLQHRKHC